jgi:hypothetical protein
LYFSGKSPSSWQADAICESKDGVGGAACYIAPPPPRYFMSRLPVVIAALLARSMSDRAEVGITSSAVEK